MSHLLFAEQLYPHAQCEKSRSPLKAMGKAMLVNLGHDNSTFRSYGDSNERKREIKLLLNYGTVEITCLNDLGFLVIHG
jgi:hypothetical protein